MVVSKTCGTRTHRAVRLRFIWEWLNANIEKKKLHTLSLYKILDTSQGVSAVEDSWDVSADLRPEIGPYHPVCIIRSVQSVHTDWHSQYLPTNLTVILLLKQDVQWVLMRHNGDKS